MCAKYRVKSLLMSSGERLPVILDSLGQPLFAPTIYALTEIRGRNLASNTIASALRALLVFFQYLDLRKISLKGRLKTGQILDLSEIEDLVRICRLPMKRLRELNNVEESDQVRTRCLSMEKHRVILRVKLEQEVIPASAANRLRSIREYLVWVVNERLSKHGVDPLYRSTLDSARNIVVNAINARLPSADNRGDLNQREGLEQDKVHTMLGVINPKSSENPWHDDHSQCRNQLAITWLYYLGLRRGELLNVRIADIDFRKGTVTVVRRADDPNDPRKYQPNVKTRSREIPVSQGLLDMTSSYIMNQRAAVKGARKHDFLFVSSDTGAPLSISSIIKVFNVLRAKCPGLPKNLSAHVLRHTWNDNYSDVMDEQRASEEIEKKTRSYLMGWSETSGTAATYTRRHIRKKAQKASLEMQRAMVRQEVTDERHDVV